MKKNGYPLSRVSHCISGFLRSGLFAVAFLPAPAVKALDKFTKTPEKVPVANQVIKPVEVLSYRLASEGPVAARELLLGQSVILKPGAEFIKIVLAFGEPVQVKSVAIETCTGEFADGVDFFFHPGQRQAFVEGGRSKALVQVPGDRAVRTLAIVLRHDTPACLKGLQLLDQKGNPVPLVFPELANATFENDDVRNLFNLTFDEPAEFAKGINNAFTFEEPQEMDRLFVWNGDQLTSETFQKSPRVKKFGILVDGGAAQNIVLADKEGVQEIALHARLKGKKFQIKPDTSGRITELRFGMAKAESEITGGDEPKAKSDSKTQAKNSRVRPRIFSAADPEYHISNSKLTHAFETASVKEALDHELTTRGDGKSWHFRFRGDSSFFVYGFNDGEDKAGYINGVGRFVVEEVEPKKITLHLHGIFVEAAGLWDGWICGAACGERESKSARPIDETIVLEKLPAGFFMVRNRSARTKRALLFTDLKSKVSSLSE